MDKGYALDRLADPQFHDSATIATAPDGPSTITRHKPACGWRTTQMGDWLVLTLEEAACRDRAGAIRAARRSSGEFVTIFSVDERRFERIP